MNTNVSCVKGTQGGKQQTIQALADSGASASIISGDLAKTINMIIYEKGIHNPYGRKWKGYKGGTRGLQIAAFHKVFLNVGGNALFLRAN